MDSELQSRNRVRKAWPEPVVSLQEKPMGVDYLGENPHTVRCISRFAHTRA
jgi:hypothetical protein